MYLNKKSLKELKDELEALAKYTSAQTQLNNHNARYHTHHETQPSGQFTKH